MKKRFLLFLLFIISVVCTTIFVLVLKYVDPYEYEVFGILVLIFSYIFGLSSGLSIVLYFIKKIYFRGKVSITNVLTSFRQSFLVSIFFLILIFFHYYGATMWLTSILAFIVLFCLELFVRKDE